MSACISRITFSSRLEGMPRSNSTWDLIWKSTFLTGNLHIYHIMHILQIMHISVYLLLCRWPSQKYKYFCLPRAIKDTKRRAADDEGEEKLGALGHDYDILLHFAIAHMRSVDGALQGKQDGTKSFDLLAPACEHKRVLFIFRADGREIYYCEPCCFQVFYSLKTGLDCHTMDGGSTFW